MEFRSNEPGFTIGEVAKRAGLTVRALHHYDAIGLVHPSARSASGYRLYGAGDIQRLHAVQSLKQLGLGLDVIGAVLAGNGVSPSELVDRQIAEAERVLQDTRALKGKLLVLRDALSHDRASPEDLLAGMNLLATYQQHLPCEGIHRMLSRWRRAKRRWQPLATEIRECQTAGVAVDAAQIQLLAQRWMNVAMEVFGGELPTVLRWVHMHRVAPETAVHAGLDPAMLDYLERAIEVRMAALRRHLSEADLGRLDGSMGPEWERFAQQGRALVEAGTPPGAASARALRGQYLALLGRTVRNDAGLAERMRKAYSEEPVLSLGHFLYPELRAYLARIPA